MLFASALHRSLLGYMSSMGNQVNKSILDRILRELENAQETVIPSHGLPIMASAELPLSCTFHRFSRPQLFVAAPDVTEPYSAAHVYLTFMAPDLAEGFGCEPTESLVMLEFSSILADDGNHHFGPDGEWGISPWLVVLGDSILAPDGSHLTLDPDGSPGVGESDTSLRQLFEAYVAGVYGFLPTGETLSESQDQDIQIGIQRVIHASVMASCHNLTWISFKPDDQVSQEYPGRYCLSDGVDIFAGKVICEEAPFSKSDGEGAYDMMLTFVPQVVSYSDKELH